MHSVCGRLRGGEAGRRLTSWGSIEHLFVYCKGVLAGLSLGGGCCCGLGPHSGEGLVWPAPLSHLPTLQRFWVQGDTPCAPGGGCVPCTLLGDRGCCCGLCLPSAEGPAWPAPLSRPLRLACPDPLPSLPLSTRAGTELPPAPCFGGGRRRCLLAWRVGVRFLTWPPLGAGTEAPPGRFGEGDGTVAKRDPARSQGGHSPVKRGRSAVMAATAVTPRCDGLFPARAALRRFSEEGDTLYPRRGLRSLHPAWGTEAASFAHLARWGLLPRFPTSMGAEGCPCLGAMERAGDFVSSLRNGIERAGVSVSYLRNGIERTGDFVNCLRNGIELADVFVSCWSQHH